MEALLTINGHVGGDVEFRLVREAYPRSSFRLACTPRTWRNGDWVDSDTTWITVNCTKALAEHVRVSVSKGDPVVVVGKLRTSRWRDETGATRERTTIEATTVGHDLSKGTSIFRKVSRAVDEAADIAEMVAAVEAQFGEEDTEVEALAAAG